MRFWIQDQCPDPGSGTETKYRRSYVFHPRIFKYICYRRLKPYLNLSPSFSNLLPVNRQPTSATLPETGFIAIMQAI
jgi:hypothetical protein